MSWKPGSGTGQKPIIVDVIVAIVAPDIDYLEHRLTRQGYSVRCWPHTRAGRPDARRGSGVVTHIRRSHDPQPSLNNVSPSQIIRDQSQLF